MAEDRKLHKIEVMDSAGERHVLTCEFMNFLENGIAFWNGNPTVEGSTVSLVGQFHNHRWAKPIQSAAQH